MDFVRLLTCLLTILLNFPIFFKKFFKYRQILICKNNILITCYKNKYLKPKNLPCNKIFEGKQAYN